jgi:hypothetical protein
MSDIPLKYIRRTRGYNRIQDTADTANDAESDSGMHTGVTAATAAARRMAKRKGKARYTDEPEEEDTLLGEEDGYREGDVEEQRLLEPASSVCTCPNCCFVWSYILVEVEHFVQVQGQKVQRQVKNDTIQTTRYMI